MKNGIILLIILNIFLFGCNKKENYKDIPDEYKSYFLFKEGSSWIYYNSKISNKDSVVLRNINSIATKPDNVCSEYRYEYKMQFTSVTTGKIFHSQTNCIKSTEINDGFCSAVISAPPQLPTMLADTYFVDTVMYRKVLLYQYMDTSFTHIVYCAYAPNIGRIRSYEVKNGDTIADYKIMRYHVSPY